MTTQPKSFFGSVVGAMGAAMLLALPEDTAVVIEIRGDEGGTWTLSRTGDDVSVTAGEVPGPDCRLACHADDFGALISGELGPQEAYADGIVGVEGDVGIALALRDAVAGQLRKAS